ncbi:hypothetical protein QFZ35_002783 [Arthrobacter ulcerisalmonis]|uniref:hypothetical protein n=1 Tax=Arthrobacter sp. B1I2 TaxID=3042263 RepID=UPI00278AA789|nr:MULTISPECIES: hypothetical protein [Arthrobacter]MDQ0664285.1 hypothetical protein [Arthrobacter ulcerisalmonis]MDQ0732195.1 hypothetical protein [Arthrobacter sp. B1I2]
MHPLVAISLVFLTGLAWTGTILTLLVSLAKARRRARAGRVEGAAESRIPEVSATPR